MMQQFTIVFYAFLKNVINGACGLFTKHSQFAILL